MYYLNVNLVVHTIPNNNDLVKLVLFVYKNHLTLYVFMIK